MDTRAATGAPSLPGVDPRPHDRANDVDAKNRDLWEAWLLRGRPPLQSLHVAMRGVFGHLPGFPRCKLCNRPFAGPFGKPLAAIGFGPSRKNPSLCDWCFERLPLGGAQIDVAVLFADLRGSTGMGERLSPTTFAAMMNRFYALATEVLLAHGAVVDKLVGDEVVALFLPGLSGPSYRSLATQAGEALVRTGSERTVNELGIDLGVGVHAGVAFVGNVGTGGVADFTALGDTVNVAARLQSVARAGELVMSEEVYLALAHPPSGLEKRVVELRGRSGPITVHVLATRVSS